MIDTQSLQTRATNILKNPAGEWPVIASESTDAASLYKQYIMPLAAIPAVCNFIGSVAFGVYVPFLGRIRVGIVSGITNLILVYALTLAGVYLAALVIEKLAPTFKSAGTTIDALKLVAYASTPGWIAGVLYLIPNLAPLVILASLYGIYLFYMGLPVLMKTPSDQVIGYMLVSAVVIIIVMVLATALSGAITRPMMAI